MHCLRVGESNTGGTGGCILVTRLLSTGTSELEQHEKFSNAERFNHLYGNRKT